MASSSTSETVAGASIFLPPLYDIVWSAVPFALILAFFFLFVMPTFRKILDERSELIEGGIAKAEAAQAQASSQLEQYNEMLSEARTEASQIREQARTDGAAILAELKEQAQADVARIAHTAQAQIEAERQAAIVSLRAEVGSLALDLASGVIGESLADDKRATSLVDRFLADLENDPAQSAASQSKVTQQ
jgi:F-type H+-transporting ATPase subunit b